MLSSYAVLVIYFFFTSILSKWRKEECFFLNLIINILRIGGKGSIMLEKLFNIIIEPYKRVQETTFLNLRLRDIVTFIVFNTLGVITLNTAIRSFCEFIIWFAEWTGRY